MCHKGVTLCQEDITRFYEGVTRCPEGVTRCQEGITRYQEGVTRCQEGVTRFQEGVAACQEGVTRCQESVTRFQEGVTRFHESVTRCHKHFTLLFTLCPGAAHITFLRNSTSQIFFMPNSFGFFGCHCYYPCKLWAAFDDGIFHINFFWGGNTVSSESIYVTGKLYSLEEKILLMTTTKKTERCYLFCQKGENFITNLNMFYLNKLK